MRKTILEAIATTDMHRQLADEINERVSAAQEHADAAVLRAVKAGQALLKSRQAGKFDAMFGPEARRVADLPQREVLRLIARRPPRPPEEEPEVEEDPVDWGARKAKREKSRAS